MRAWNIAALAVLLAAGHAQGDEPNNEDRLRDALRQAVSQMHAAQDQAGQAQADAARAHAEQQAVQAQLDAALAKLATAAPAKPAAPAADVQGLQDALQQALAQNAALQQGLAKSQTAYNGAAEAARSKDAESHTAAAKLAGATKVIATCKTENTKLIALGEQILTLYQSQSFRSILLRSYEPLIGSAKVTLENMVQKYDDEMHDQEFVAPALSPIR